MGRAGARSNRGQDAASRRVLMVAWMDRTALTTTIASGQAHFWSRARGELWRKETSGNTMEVVGLSLDCDGDTILMAVSLAGPACHTARCPVSTADTPTLGSILDRLHGVGGTGRTTSQGFLHRRVGRCRCRPGGEEGAGGAGELAFIAKDRAAGRGSQSSVAEEAADLLYHLFCCRHARCRHRPWLASSRNAFSLMSGGGPVRRRGPSSKAWGPRRCCPA